MFKYAKFWAALISAVLVAVHTLAGHQGPYTAQTILTVFSAAIGPLLVYFFPNTYPVPDPGPIPVPDPDPRPPVFPTSPLT